MALKNPKNHFDQKHLVKNPRHLNKPIHSLKKNQKIILKPKIILKQ